MKETFGQYIRQLRNSKGYNLTKLAAMLDIDSGALSKIETDKKVFDDKLLPKLAKIFDLDLPKLKDEYYSETIAKVLCEKHYSNGLLALAEEKVKYIRSKKTKQAKLKFE